MSSQLEKVTAEILSRIQGKYILTLRAGSEHLSTDELAGIIALGFEFQAQKTVKIEFDTKDLTAKLAEIRQKVMNALAPRRVN